MTTKICSIGAISFLAMFGHVWPCLAMAIVELRLGVQKLQNADRYAHEDEDVDGDASAMDVETCMEIEVEMEMDKDMADPRHACRFSNL